jgi:hypothetical protein
LIPLSIHGVNEILILSEETLLVLHDIRLHLEEVAIVSCRVASEVHKIVAKMAIQLDA